jgi:hypothetical protein
MDSGISAEPEEEDLELQAEVYGGVVRAPWIPATARA